MPRHCPHENCFDKFPVKSSKTLREMVRYYKATLDADQTHNPFGAAAYRQAIIICAELKSELKKEKYLALADKTWPYPLDFFKLSERVLLMQSEIAGIIEDKKQRAQSIAYQQLLVALGGTESGLKRLASAVIPPGSIMTTSRPG